MARGWLSRVVKQGFIVSLTTQDRIGRAGQRLSEGWSDLVAEARAEHTADRTRRSAEAAEAVNISTASERLERAAQQAERSHETGGAGLVIDPADREGATAGPTHQSNHPSTTATVDAASERLQEAEHKGRRKRDEGGGLTTAAEAAAEGGQAPADAPFT
jgi:hypothetical protein